MTRFLGWLSGWWRGFVRRHIVAPLPEPVSAVSDAEIDARFSAAFAEYKAWMQKRAMPELASTDYSVWNVWEWEDGSITFDAYSHAYAAAYLICRSAREAVS